MIEGSWPFPRGDNKDIEKINWRNSKTFFSRTTEPISTKLDTKHPWVKGIQVCSNKWLRPFSRGNNYQLAEIKSFLSFDIAIPYLAHKCRYHHVTMCRIHSRPLYDLALWPQYQNSIFTMNICLGKTVFALWHRQNLAHGCITWDNMHVVYIHDLWMNLTFDLYVGGGGILSEINSQLTEAGWCQVRKIFYMAVAINIWWPQFDLFAWRSQLNSMAS